MQLGACQYSMSVGRSLGGGGKVTVSVGKRAVCADTSSGWSAELVGGRHGVLR